MISLKIAAALVVVLFQHCPPCVSERALFSVGKEFKYQYETLVTAGSEEPVSFASAYKLKGALLVSAVSSTTLSVKLDGLEVGMYNGPWSYFPIPEMRYFSSPDLAPLSEPFEITVKSGKVTGISLDDHEMEWASNLKRGLATHLQLDLEDVSFDNISILNRKELTTLGECNTKYEILPSSATPNKLTRVNKFRSHVDCLDVPTRTRYATHIFNSCSDENTRDLMNSTAYSTYEMESDKDGEPLLKKFTLFSSVLYWPFTSSGPYQFSWVNMTLSLDSVSQLENKAFPHPPNAVTHEDLSYVFEQLDPTVDAEDENPDLTNEVLFFHHMSVDSDPETYQKTVEMTRKVISKTAESLVNSEVFFKDIKRFHFDSPSTLIPLIASLDYQNLEQLYQEYNIASTENSSKRAELQIFLDGLILAGTTPSTLVIRDILLSSNDSLVLSRLAPSLPHLIRNPTEALASEMDPLFELVKREDLSLTITRPVTFAMASLIGRCCRKTNCVSTGLLEKYINYFEDKLATATDFDERTVGLLGLRNLRVGKSLDKVLDIAAGKLVYEPPLRVQALWSLRSLAKTDSHRLMSTILPIFYNRSEPCELRSSVFGFLMSVGPDEKLLLDIAYFMWTETCPMISNYVRSHLMNTMYSKSPCNSPLKSYARTILRYLPPAEVDPLKTTSYMLDYYDPNSGFGHQIASTIHKSGETALPLTIYLGLNNYIGGYGSSYFGLYIRMEGLEKAITDKISSMTSANVDEISKILSQVGVRKRPSSPLFLEFTVVYHDYVMFHLAVDEGTLSNVRNVLQKIGSLKEALTTTWQRSVLLGGIFQQFPLEIGTPVSILAGVTGIGSIDYNIESKSNENVADMKLQFNLFGVSRISNHAPGLNTMHSMTSYRGLRLIVPRRFGIYSNVLFHKNPSITILMKPPAQMDPLLAMAHGTSLTSVNYDSPTRVNDELALEILRKSCSQCLQDAIVSRGPQFRQSRSLLLDLPSSARGVVGEAKFFDCEGGHSRTTMVIKKLKNLFRGENQYAGFVEETMVKLFLSLSHIRDQIFISPYAETCGVYARVAGDEDADIKLEGVEGHVEGGVAFRDSNGQENFTAFFVSKLDFVFAGTTPSVTQLKFNAEFHEHSIETKTIKLKFQANDEISGHHGVMCIKIDTSANRFPKDLLSYEGENEPQAGIRIKIQIGKVTKEETNKEDPPCSENYAAVDVKAQVTRSFDQLAEASSNIYPYSQCNAEKASPGFPGNFIPPTPACHAAAYEQTSLRAINVTIDYKITEEIEARWKGPSALIAAFMYSYLRERNLSSSVSSHTVPTASSGPGQNYLYGKIAMDINARKSLPVMDVYFHDITRSSSETYYGVDLTLIPSLMRPSPIQSRMSPIWTLGFKSGAVSHCSVTPASVITLDQFVYPSLLSECWTLLSADCGINARFGILGKKVSTEKMAIAVHFGESSVEFHGDTKEALIDGKPVTLEDKEIFIEDVGGTPPPFDVFKNGDEGYVISKTLGIYVRYTGYFVTVTLDSRYRIVHCGLCGHWDSSPYNDLIGPDSNCSALLGPEDMSPAYVVKEGNCGTLGNQCPSPASS